MKLTNEFNEDGVMKNGKQFRKEAHALNEKESNLKQKKRMSAKKENKGHAGDKLNKPVRGRRELPLQEEEVLEEDC